MTVKGEATVVKHTGSHYLLAHLPEWDLFPAVLRGKIRLKGSTATNPVAVGDKVTFEADGPVFEVKTDPDAFTEVLAALEAKGYTFVGAEVEMVPQNYIKLATDDDVKMMEKLLGMLEDNEDVQNVWHNWDQE